MLAPVSVVFADDSTMFRSVLRRLLDEPRFDVLASARDGIEALAKVREHHPDVLLLDVEMPGLDGLGVLRALRESRDAVRIILVSSLTATGSATTLEGLRLGAFDFVAKPFATTLAANLQELADTLVPKLLAIAALPRRVRAPSSPPVPTRRFEPLVPPVRPLSAQRPVTAPRLIAIATSTGGPVALLRVIPALPPDLPVPVVIIQHMPAGFTKALAQRLDQLSAVRVVEAEHGQRLEAGVVYFAPGGQHMTIVAHAGLAPTVSLDEGERVLGCRPAADRLFPSVAEVYGARVLAVVLTGMGEDASEGCRAVKLAGGKVVGEAESSCVVYGMPRAVAAAGHTDAVHDLSTITKRLGAWGRGESVMY